MPKRHKNKFDGLFIHFNLKLLDKPATKKPPERTAIINGAEEETRTPDPRITNALLYQLSYFGNEIAYTPNEIKLQAIFYIKF